MKKFFIIIILILCIIGLHVLVVRSRNKYASKLFSYVSKGDIKKLDNFLKKKKIYNNINYETKTNINALVIAVDYGELEMVKYLLKKGAILEKDKSWVYLAVGSNNLDLVEYLLKKGCNINNSYEGNTPLMRAVIKDNPEMVKYLLKKGARTDIKNNENKTALDIDQNLNKDFIAKILKEKN